MLAASRDSVSSMCTAREPEAWPVGLGFCRLIPSFLSAAECAAMVALAEGAGFGSAATDYPPSYRDNERLVHDDRALAARLFERLHGRAPERLLSAAADGTPQHVRLARINERLRFCRYRAGQQFRIHQDGVYFADEQHRSHLTFMIYLTDGEAFEGGDTVFYARGPDADGAPPVVARVRPRAGMLILFDHTLWHAGEPVTRGQKHVMRSDVLYRRTDSLGRVAAAPAGPSRDHASQAAETPYVGHHGYVWTLAQLPGGRVASGGRDTVIRLWDASGRLTGSLRGHTRSVLGLSAYTAHAGRGVDAARLASVSRDRTLKLWDLETQACVHTVVAHEAAVLSVVSLPAPAVRLATASADTTIKLWNHHAEPLATLRGHRSWVWGVCRLGTHALASASEDGEVRLWQLDDAGEGLALSSPSRTPLRTLAASPDQASLVTGDQRGVVNVWTDLATTPRLAASFRAHRAAVRCVCFVDDHTLLTTGEDNAVHTWHLPTQSRRATSWHQNFATAALPLGAANCISSSYDGSIACHARVTATDDVAG